MGSRHTLSVHVVAEGKGASRQSPTPVQRTCLGHLVESNVKAPVRVPAQHAGDPVASKDRPASAPGHHQHLARLKELPRFDQHLPLELLVAGTRR